MEILLLHDIKGIGKKNDLLVVGDGFALNCLLPERMALVATPLVRRHYAEQIRVRAQERERERQMRIGAAQALAGTTLIFTRKITKTGKLYAAISEELIASALKTEHGIAIDADAVQIATPIKTTGTFTVQVKLAGHVVPVSVAVYADAPAAAKKPKLAKAAA